MKIIYVILSISLLAIVATAAKGWKGEWEDDDPFQETQDTTLEDDAVSDTYQPLDKPTKVYYQQEHDTTPQKETIPLEHDTTPQKETIPLDQQEEALQEQEEAPQEEETTAGTNEAQTQDGSCVCKERVKKALLQSLQSCINVLNAMETCTSRNKRSVDVNMQLMSSCACSDKVNNDLIQSLKSCTDAIFTSSSCTTKKTYSSCAEIKRHNPRSASGYYSIVANSRNVSVYCHMGTLCGVGGGWARLGKLDMTVGSSRCPSTLVQNTVSGTRLCTKNANNCQSVPIPSLGIQYSQVCGRVRGYQKHSTDAFRHHQKSSINSAYLDGVSITRGSPRKHIWSLAVGHSESTANVPHGCPCNTGASSSVRPAPFVGNDFYCESGYSSGTANQFAVADPLWDKKLCRGREAPCCSPRLLPWFLKRIGSTTTDNLEMRLCIDEGVGNENVGVDQYEFYVM